MTNLDSARNNETRPQSLMDKYSIKKDTYYSRIKFLGIQVKKGSNRKVYLTDEQVALMDELHLYIAENGRMEGFESRKNLELVTTNNNSLTTSVNNSADLSVVDNGTLQTANSTELSSHGTNEPDIYVTPEEPTSQFNMEQLMYEAAELKARELAMQDLVKRALADGMNEEDLPPELRDKVQNAREAANPKFTPQQVAGTLLTQWRENRLAS
ncbi:hypothetical protein [Crocosphaera sp.]|uniref:hypothetical protein n=1 Tax=Crocosphaera sp. TaxID=2729996 RepID=UPI0026395F38|nr:hypothetical protein [Crocosphaera sp.]MDJ0580970.1 hypothetical protein [Crocosphaera sp.]